jgi:hypothetical protein
MTKALFLRVGADIGCGRTLAPRFDDGSFEYVPIPESRAVIPGRGTAYADLPARSGGTLAAWIKHDGYAHHDPEFSSFTYGEPSMPKRAQLLRLQKDDYLVFYAGMQGEGFGRGTCFVIGYFVVACVHQPPAGEPWPPASLQRLHGNAHFRRANPEPDLVVVEGDPALSKLFRKALPLSDASESRQVLREVAQKTGVTGSVLRAVGRWVPQSHIVSTLAWLHGGAAAQ